MHGTYQIAFAKNGKHTIWHPPDHYPPCGPLVPSPTAIVTATFENGQMINFQTKGHTMSSLEARIDSLECRVKALEMCQETPRRLVPGPGVYLTKGGGKAYIYTTKGIDEEYPVVGEHVDEDGENPEADVWTKYGEFYEDEESHFDILPERKLS